MTLRRIKLKVGIVEVEVEGEQGDLDKVAINLLGRATELPAIGGEATNKIAKPEIDYDLGDTDGRKNGNTNREPTMIMLANIRGCKTGKDLTRVACEYIHFVKSKPFFDRHDLVKEMKKAKSFYKKSFANNIKFHYLKPLQEHGILSERTPGVFFLTNEALKAASPYFAELGLT